MLLRGAGGTVGRLRGGEGDSDGVGIRPEQKGGCRNVKSSSRLLQLGREAMLDVQRCLRVLGGEAPTTRGRQIDEEIVRGSRKRYGEFTGCS